jgi:hypothetical protein
MLSGPQPEPKSAFKNPLLYSSIILAAGALIVGWIFFSRWLENKQIDRKTAQQETEKRLENDRAALQQFGGKELAIQAFYAYPAAIHRGDKAQLCYGVANAKTVKLEPQSSPVWPSYSRCVEVSPTKDTTFTLTIEDGAGNTKSQTAEVKVH